MLKNFINTLIAKSLLYESRMICFFVGMIGITTLIIYKYFSIISWESFIVSFVFAVIIHLMFIFPIENKIINSNLSGFVRYEKVKIYVILILCAIFFCSDELPVQFFLLYIMIHILFWMSMHFPLLDLFYKYLNEKRKLDKVWELNREFNIFIILLFFIIYFVMIEYIPNNQFIVMKMLIIIFLVITIYILFCGKANKELESSRILIKNYNIDYDKLLNTAIVNLGVSDSYQIILIDLSSIFPASSTERSACVFNHYSHFDNTTEKCESLAVALPRCKVNKKLNIYYTYKQQDGKMKRRKCSLYISIESNSNMTYIANYKLKDFKVAVIRYDKCLNYLKSKKFNSLYIPLNSIKYNVEITDERKFNSKLEPRKWLLHDDKFGAGKSVYDLNYIMNLGLQPVIISPWEENYDRDLLQLIFNRLSKKYSHSFSFFPPRNLLPFVCVCFAGVALFLLSDQMQPIYNFILSFVAKDSLPNCESFKEGICLLKHLLNILILILSWFFIMMFLPSIIILKKDSSKIYQDYYIEKIRKILNENKFVCILIEDVDRLDFAVHNEIFRILSLINKVAYNREFFIGIISLDKKLMEDSKTCFESIENKLIGYNIGTNYSQSESVKIYMNDGLKFLQKYSKKDLEVMCENIVKENFKNKELNFRDAKFLMNMLIQNIIEEKKSNI